MPSFDTFVNKYLHCLDQGDLKELLNLFAPEAVVQSPLYGVLSATQFYTELFSDTTNSGIALLDHYAHKTDNKACCHFRYEWELKNGEKVSFEVVDIFEFNNDNLITRLNIIYDTQNTRPAFSAQKEE